MPKGDICTIEGCEKKVRYGLICQSHNWRMKVHGYYEKPSRRRYGNNCRVMGCDSPRDMKQRSSLCTMHRVRQSRFKSFDLPTKKPLPDGIGKICIHHGELSFEDTYSVPNSNQKNCKICRIIRSENKRNSRPKGYKNTRNFIHIGNGKDKRFKVSIKEYEKLHDIQKGLCAICSKPELHKANNKLQENPKRLSLDHCHIHKKIRGLLCQKCNTGLGSFKDSIETLESAILYLKSHQG